MPSTFKLVIHAVHLNGINGYYTLTASIEEHLDAETILKGVPETFSLSHDELCQRFEGDPVKWRTQMIAPFLIAKHTSRRNVNEAILGWQGQKFDA